MQRKFDKTSLSDGLIDRHQFPSGWIKYYLVWLIVGGAAEWQTIPKLCEGDAEADDGFQDLQNSGETSQIPGKITS